MNSKITLSALIITITALTLSLVGCNKKENPDSTSTSNQICVTESTVESTQSTESISESVPKGEPTFLIGLDGEPILTSEITRLENTSKTAETLTKDDLCADVYCEGFAYLKKPSGIAYSTYKNPEMFTDGKFTGEIPENKNPWKRVNIGDEICGLKVKSATSHFQINDSGYTFPECYYSSLDGSQCEFEGTIEIEGFLQVLPDNIQYTAESRLVNFFPCESKLPVGVSYPDSEKGYITTLAEHSLFDHYDGDFEIVSECERVLFGTLNEMTCDMDGIGKGDIAYARVTLGNIKLTGGAVDATLEKVERISDILAHDDDITSTGGTMGI